MCKIREGHLPFRHHKLQIHVVFTHLSVLPHFLQNTAFAASSWVDSVHMQFCQNVRTADVGFLSLGDVFADGNFGVCRVAGLCFTWKYYLCPRDLWWLCYGAFLSCNHCLYRRTKKKKKKQSNNTRLMHLQFGV